MGVSLGGIGALISGGSALAGLLGGSKTPQAPQGYQFANSSGADAGAFGGIGQLGQYNTAASTLGQGQQTAQSLYNNPYAQWFQGQSNQNAMTGLGVSGQQVGAGQSLMNSGQSLLPWQQQILQTGFDPMQNIYNTQQQLNTDQTRAGEAARGIAMSPYGAGVENQSNMLFNQNWQNNLLNRQNTAAQGAGYLGNSAANQINLGQNVSTLGLQGLNNAAQLPYNTAQTIGTNQFGALNAYGQLGQQASQIPQQTIADYLQYLQGGNAANATANQGYANQLTAQNQQFNQQQTLGKNLGSAFSGLGTAYSNYGSGAPLGSINVGGQSYPAYR
jgi:hypothetical protein